jgi:putative transposase
MSLWHTDWYDIDDGRLWIAYMDGASRLIVAYGVFQEETVDNALQVLKRAIAKYGKPKEILTDHGSQFYANEGERKEKGISRFEAFLAEQGIRHILARVNHPQTHKGDLDAQGEADLNPVEEEVQAGFGRLLC